MADKENITERTHPLYDKYLPEWNFFMESALGGKDYCDNEDNLFTHRLEDQAGDYEDRLERVYYLNYCGLVCSTYSEYIFKEIVNRPEDTLLDEFRKDVDGRGTDINTFMAKVSTLSSIYGHVHIVVDNSEFDYSSKIPLHVYKKNRTMKPYVTIVQPQDLRDWSIDEFGNVLWILIRRRGYSDADPLSPREPEDTYRLITREEWYVFDKDGNMLKEGTNNLGEVYLVTCYNKDTDSDMIGESLITDVARINRIIYNWCSNIDEMIERQTFSQLVMPDDPQSQLYEKDEKGTPLEILGTSQIFTFPASAGHPPQFISPDTSQIKIIWEMIQEHIDKIYELSGLGMVGERSKFMSQRSGVSLAYQFTDVNSSLAKKAAKLEKAENEIYQFVCLWNGKARDSFARVEYPKQFDISSLTEVLATTFDIVSQDISETLSVELLKALVKKAVPALPDEIISQINDEIKAKGGKIALPFSNTNTNLMGRKTAQPQDKLGTKNTADTANNQ